MSILNLSKRYRERNDRNGYLQQGFLFHLVDQVKRSMRYGKYAFAGVDEQRPNRGVVGFVRVGWEWGSGIQITTRCWAVDARTADLGILAS